MIFQEIVRFSSPVGEDKKQVEDNGRPLLTEGQVFFRKTEKPLQTKQSIKAGLFFNLSCPCHHFFNIFVR